MRQTVNCIVISTLPVHIQVTEWSQCPMGLIQQIYGMQKEKVLIPALPPCSYIVHMNPYVPSVGVRLLSHKTTREKKSVVTAEKCASSTEVT